MGGRSLTLPERMARGWFWAENVWPRVRYAASIPKLFVRWAWLRLSGKTAYRFAPMYEGKINADRSIRQANGLYLPWPKTQSHFDDVRADMLAAWDVIEAKDK